MSDSDGVRHRIPVQPAETPSAEPVKPKKFDNDKYNTRKTMAKGLLDVTLLTNNVSSLKNLLRHQGTERENPFFEWVVGAVLLSICIQVRFALCPDLKKSNSSRIYNLTFQCRW